MRTLFLRVLRWYLRQVIENQQSCLLLHQLSHTLLSTSDSEPGRAFWEPMMRRYLREDDGGFSWDDANDEDEMLRYGEKMEELVALASADWGAPMLGAWAPLHIHHLCTTSSGCPKIHDILDDVHSGSYDAVTALYLHLHYTHLPTSLIHTKPVTHVDAEERRQRGFEDVGYGFRAILGALLEDAQDRRLKYGTYDQKSHKYPVKTPTLNKPDPGIHPILRNLSCPYTPDLLRKLPPSHMEMDSTVRNEDNEGCETSAPIPAALLHRT
ncbi:hypothetical protein Tco_0701542 [Tanacetum coccineum]